MERMTTPTSYAVSPFCCQSFVGKCHKNPHKSFTFIFICYLAELSGCDVVDLCGEYLSSRFLWALVQCLQFLTFRRLFAIFLLIYNVPLGTSIKFIFFVPLVFNSLYFFPFGLFFVINSLSPYFLPT